MIKKRNWFSLILAFAMLVGMVPLAALPVSGAPNASPYLVMNLVDPTSPTSIAMTAPDNGYNVTGSIVKVTAFDPAGIAIAPTLIAGWSIFNSVVAPLAGPAVFVPNGPPGAVNPVFVQGDWGEATIQCTLLDGTQLEIEKKWGKIDYTKIDEPKTSPVTWIEAEKAWEGSASISDMVYGIFVPEQGAPYSKPVEGVILNWYLIHGAPAVVAPAVKHAENWKDVFAALPDAIFAKFVINGVVDGAYQQTVSDGTGESVVNIATTGEEAVTVIVVPEYPVPIQLDVEPEYTSINFWTREMEKVPQVRWAGEKIVLEKNWGVGYAGHLVSFSLENQSPGALETISIPIQPLPSGFHGDSQRVWTRVDAKGLASAMLVCEDMGEVDVDCAIYSQSGTSEDYVIDNQHGFVVYFLKLESLALQNVVGKRSGHNTGAWTPSNPWDDTLDPAKNVLEETLNVSADTLLRARVKGWFTNANPSMRPEGYLDMDQDGDPDLLLPKGRWVLPDDWAALAGPNWQQDRLHWDIMDNPSDAVDAPTPRGAYDTVDGQTGLPVVGPFSPGIELMTPNGWDVTSTVVVDALRPYRTVVPNGVLEWWDAPMPPAKIIFEILDKTVNSNFPNGPQNIGNAGFFKWADKAEIYYVDKYYTNPFYCEMIPAHEAIPAFVNNGGYDWNSFDSNYGPYVFWTIINRPDFAAGAQVDSDDPANRPTKVEVYSDNHGEAMVYLNGDWNLNLMGYNVNGAADVPNGAVVGSTTVQAMADYPYFRKHQPILSNTVTKTWIWGGMVLGTDGIGYLDGTAAQSSLIINTTGAYTITTPGGADFPNDVGTSNKKMVWLWLTDRDYLRNGVLGAKVAWRITGGGNSVFISAANGSLSNYNPTMQNIKLVNGFLAGTNGAIVAGSAGAQGTSVTRVPTVDEIALFNKYYPGYDAENFVVAGVEIQTAGPLIDVSVFMDITAPDFNGGFGGATIYRTANVDFSAAYPLDDQILKGDANIDGTINMGDVTAVEMGILGLMTKNINADANGDGEYNMADVIKIERSILGLP